jgi:hypothetical protein
MLQISFLCNPWSCWKWFSTGRQYTVERKMNCWYELSIAPMKETENMILFLLSFTWYYKVKLIDESLAVRKYRGLLDNLDAGIVVHAADTSVIMSNNKASELWV